MAEEVFGLLEPLITRHYPEFDHYSFATIASSIWKGIAGELRTLGPILRGASSIAEIRGYVGFLFTNTDSAFEAAFEANKEALAALAEELAAWVDARIAQSEPISVLGI